MSSREHRLATSVLVVGTGGSGLRAAIELAESGVDVLAVGKRPTDDAHTSLAAGGINAALATTDPADTWEQHAADTLQESYLLADPRTVQVVTQNAARGILRPGALRHALRPPARRPDRAALLRCAHLPAYGVRRRLHGSGAAARTDRAR